MDFWQTVAGGRLLGGTIPSMERNLDRIATALEKMVLAQDTPESPLCDWCDHRHFPTAICLADVWRGCDCKH